MYIITLSLNPPKFLTSNLHKLLKPKDKKSIFSLSHVLSQFYELESLSQKKWGKIAKNRENDRKTIKKLAEICCDGSYAPVL